MAAEQYHIDTGSGQLYPARQVPSPNQGPRPEGTPIDLAVIHAISLPPGEFGGDAIDRLFTNRLDPQAHPYFAGIAGLRVSAHLLIRRHGGTTQYVPFHRRAWHAGRSSFAGRTECNDYSIGIELEGDERHSFTAAQYRALSGILAALTRTYPGLGRDRIVGHADIAPGRKTDPGPRFDWDRLFAELDRITTRGT